MGRHVSAEALQRQLAHRLTDHDLLDRGVGALVEEDPAAAPPPAAPPTLARPPPGPAAPAKAAKPRRSLKTAVTTRRWPPSSASPSGLETSSATWGERNLASSLRWRAIVLREGRPRGR